MSFRLILYRERNFSPLEPEAVDQVVLVLPHTRRTQQQIREYTCDHPATGESFQFVLSRTTALIYHLDVSGMTLDFGIGYGTSEAIVADAFSTVFDLAGRLDARIHNCQEPKGLSEPENHKALMSSFIKHRDAGIEAARGSALGIGAVKVAREKTDYCHAYLHWRDTLEDSVFGLDVHVPEQIHMMRPGGGDSVVLVMRWPDLVPMIFPEVDYVLIERDKKGFLGLTVGRDSGLVPLGQIIKLLGVDLMREEKPIPHYVYKRPEPKPEVQKAADKLPLISLNSFLEPELEDLVEV